jgi:hypothetical protein
MSKKEPMVHIVAVLDRSGSMAGDENEVIGSFNNFIDEQRKIEGKAKVTLVLFDDSYEVPYRKIPLDDVPTLTEDFNKKKNVVFLIQTDGGENASSEYADTTKIKKMVKDKTKAGWEFHFIGADIDAFDSGHMMGITPSNIFNVNKTRQGYMDQTAIFSATASNYRSSVANKAKKVVTKTTTVTS